MLDRIEGFFVLHCSLRLSKDGKTKFVPRGRLLCGYVALNKSLFHFMRVPLLR